MSRILCQRIPEYPGYESSKSEILSLFYLHFPSPEALKAGRGMAQIPKTVIVKLSIH